VFTGQNYNAPCSAVSLRQLSILFLVCDQSSSVGLCMLNYKSLHVAIMICATWLTYTHITHTNTNNQTTFDRLYY